MTPKSPNPSSENPSIKWPQANRGVGDASIGISIHNESEKRLPIDEESIRHLIRIVIFQENVKVSWLELIYVTPEEITRINSEFLGKQYVTDNIAFQYEEPGESVEATIFQCPYRIEEQALELQTSLLTEFVRVLIHGVLHISGYKDESDVEKMNMRSKENDYLKQFDYI